RPLEPDLRRRSAGGARAAPRRARAGRPHRTLGLGATGGEPLDHDPDGGAREGAHTAADRPRGARGVPPLPGRRARQGARRRRLPGRRPGAGGALVVCARPGRVLGGDGRHGGAARVAARRALGGGARAGEARGDGGDREVPRRRRLPHPRAGPARVGAGVGSRAAAPAVAPNYQAGSAATPTFVQGTAFSSGSRVLTTTVTLTSPVAGGDLLVGWFSQYNVPGQVEVSDNVNGAWTRAPGSLHFLDDTGDIALYYRENSQGAPSGMTITVSASSAAYLQGTVADYSGVALAGSLDQIVTARGQGTVVDTGASAAVDAGELVFAALVTGGSPGSVTPGSSLSVPYTARAQTPNGSAFEEDITSSAAGAQ